MVMNKVNNKGYMLIEIILAFAIAFGLMYFVVGLTINLKNKNDDLLVKTVLTTDQSIVSNELMERILDNKIQNEDMANTFCEQINFEGNTIKYGAEIINTISDYGKIKVIDNEHSCMVGETYINIKIPIEVKQLPDENFDIDVYYEFKKRKIEILTCNEILQSYQCNSQLNGEHLFEYSKKCEVIGPDKEGEGNCKIRFLESGTLKINADFNIDTFLVGGGGGGSSTSSSVGGGGGGGYTNTIKNIILEVGEYKINIGNGGSGNNSGTGGRGGTSSITKNDKVYFNLIASGGYGGKTQNGINSYGGNGGSGGGGWNDRNDGTPGCPGRLGNNGYGSKGQITTPGPNGETGNTREFGESSGKEYAGGGASGCCCTTYGGGGYCNGAANYCNAGTPNTGGGGGAYYNGAKSGGSGIVIIRNAR